MRESLEPLGSAGPDEGQVLQRDCHEFEDDGHERQDASPRLREATVQSVAETVERLAGGFDVRDHLLEFDHKANACGAPLWHRVRGRLVLPGDRQTGHPCNACGAPLALVRPGSCAGLHAGEGVRRTARYTAFSSGSSVGMPVLGRSRHPGVRP